VKEFTLNRCPYTGNRDKLPEWLKKPDR
jgi:hypothetical protein